MANYDHHYIEDVHGMQGSAACGCLGRLRRKRRKPSRRFGHVAVAVEGSMVVWGGGMQGGLFLEDRFIPSNELWIYQTDTEKWYQVSTHGPHTPPGASGAGAVVVNHTMYVFGGLVMSGNSNETWALDLRTRVWTYIKIDSDLHKPSPRDRFVMWEHENQLYVFGGFGHPTQGYLHEHGDFYVDTNTWQPVRGWNNQLLRLDLSTNRWENPSCHGDIPTPRSGHAVAKIGNTVYTFAGHISSKRLHDLYKLDLDTLTWTWMQTDTTKEQPCGRSWHTLTPISPTHIFLYGGFGNDGETLSDAWFLDTTDPGPPYSWTRMSLSLHKPRIWHSGVCTSDGDVLVFGGCCNDVLTPSEPSIHSNDLIIFRCSPKSLLRLCLDAAFAHRSVLASQWSSLPKPLANVLRLRMDAEGHRLPPTAATSSPQRQPSRSQGGTSGGGGRARGSGGARICCVS